MIGVLQNATESDLKKYGVDHGVKISRLSQRYKASWKNNGIKEGSIVTAINDVKINTIEDVEQIMNNRKEYNPLRIELINDNGEKERYYFE